MLTLTLKLILAHLLGDFVFQSKAWADQKEEKHFSSKYLYVHGLIHLILVMPVFFYYNIWGALLIFITHILIDGMKGWLTNDRTKIYYFFLDQILHVLIILSVAGYYSNSKLDMSWIESPKLILACIVLLFATAVSSVIMKIVISIWEISFSASQNIDLKNAGRFIGMLERLLIVIFICFDFWEGIGYLLAAKSVFRFGDLKKQKDKNLTEYILFGTLLSFVLAILSGILLKYGIRYLN